MEQKKIDQLTCDFLSLFFFGLNMFMVFIKLGSLKFSPYLILIVLLAPKKNLCTQY